MYYSYPRPEMVNFVKKDAKKILDIGCGEGTFSLLLKKEKERDIWGVEINEEAGKKAKEVLNKVFIGDINLIINDLPDEFFDCIIFNDVLEHMADPYTLLEKIKRKLSPGGNIVCSIPNVRHVRVLRDLLFKKQWKYQDAGVLDKTHLRFFTKKSIIDMFNNLDYEIIEIKGIHPTKLWMFLPINLVTLGLFSDSRFIQFACIVRPKN